MCSKAIGGGSCTSSWAHDRSVGQSGVWAPPPKHFLRAGGDRSLEKAVSEKTLSIARTIFTLHYAAGWYRRAILPFLHYCIGWFCYYCCITATAVIVTAILTAEHHHHFHCPHQKLFVASQNPWLNSALVDSIHDTDNRHTTPHTPVFGISQITLVTLINTNASTFAAILRRKFT